MFIKPRNALFIFCSGAVPRGFPKSHMAFWGEEKCTLEVSNRRKKLFKRRLQTYRRAFRRRLPLAKYKIQLVFLAVSQRVGLYILLQLYLFRHAGKQGENALLLWILIKKLLFSLLFSSLLFQLKHFNITKQPDVSVVYQYSAGSGCWRIHGFSAFGKYALNGCILRGSALVVDL